MAKKIEIKAEDWRRRPRPWARKPETEKRSESIEVRLTIQERDELRRAAEDLGLSLSEVCRRAIVRTIADQLKIELGESHRAAD
jgi:uncharacterized protein (DUF1778 family)